MNQYHNFKTDELVWCNLYPGVYQITQVTNRDEKNKPYGDLLHLKLVYGGGGNHGLTHTVDESHCAKLEIGIKEYIKHLNEKITELNTILKNYGDYGDYENI